MRIYLFAIVISCSLLIGCKSESSTKEPTKVTLSSEGNKPTSAQKKWEYIQSELSLTDKQIVSLKSIERRFRKRNLKLKKDGLWAGAENKANRNNFSANKKREITRALREKAEDYIELKIKLSK